MNKVITTGLLVIGFVGANAAFADQYHHHETNNQMQYNEHQRIKQGVESGSLTREEAKGLAQQQKQIRTEERAYKSDGRYTPAERQNVHQDLQQSSKSIYQEKHNGQ
ncbi:MAG: hypothetical protein P4L77_01015 [Sulfuriferula sp.]|nr:hypothetical protein [Sulfuriferula sp.]